MTRASAFGTCFRGWGTAFLDSFSNLTKSPAMAPVVARRRAVIFFIHGLLLRLLLSETEPASAPVAALLRTQGRYDLNQKRLGRQTIRDHRSADPRQACHARDCADDAADQRPTAATTFAARPNRGVQCVSEMSPLPNASIGEPDT